jgi:hypothetical protein
VLNTKAQKGGLYDKRSQRRSGCQTKTDDLGISNSLSKIKKL